MTRSSLFPLALSTILALGCATADAQDDTPPEPGPVERAGVPRAGDPVAAPLPEARMKELRAEAHAIEKRAKAAEDEVAAVEREVAHLQESLQEERAAGGAEKLENGRTMIEETLHQAEARLEDHRNLLEELRQRHGRVAEHLEKHHRLMDLHRARLDPREWLDSGQRRGHGVEERLDHLERAMHEIHELFQRSITG